MYFSIKSSPLKHEKCSGIVNIRILTYIVHKSFLRFLQQSCRDRVERSLRSHALLCIRSACEYSQILFERRINTSTSHGIRYVRILRFQTRPCNKISPFARAPLRSDRNAGSTPSLYVLFLLTFSYRNDKCRGIHLKYNTVALYRPLSFYRAAFFVLPVLF